MSAERARPAFVEEEDENGQAVPGTRLSAQAPTSAPSSSVDKNTPNPTQRSKKFSKKSIVPIDIPVAQAYNKFATMAGHPGNQNLFYHQTLPPAEGRPQYMTYSHPRTAISYPQPLENTLPTPYGSYPMPPPIPKPSLPYSSHPPHLPPLPHPPHLPPLPHPPHLPPLPHPQNAPHNPYYPPHHSPYPFHPPPPNHPSSPFHPPQFHPPPSQSPSYGVYHASPPDIVYQPVRSISRNASRPLASRFDFQDQYLDRLSDPIQRSTSAFGARDLVRPRSRTMERPGHGHIESSSSSYWSHERKTDLHEPAYVPQKIQEQTEPAEDTHLTTRRRSIESYKDSQDSHESKAKFSSVARSRRPSVSFDVPPKSEKVRFEPSPNSGRRRQSWYDPLMPYNSLVAKLNNASKYLEEVMGPETSIPLNSEISRRQKRQDAKSRSTRSSQSQDESDIKRSETTRSGSPNEDQNMTIKVISGSARVTLGGAQIDCAEGGAIEIKRDRSSRDNTERYSPDYSSSRQTSEDQRPRSRRSEKRADRHRENSHSFRESSSNRGYGERRYEFPRYD
ncbi:hypothetical protein GcC1_161001 [Golovinomyces cichoracearum]|uniref:Uncharacterized protein n=1 Tax=Golovinomyces cichoracearum TaxID=62708 RepID=A0A420HU34_9PEZI|nr:hypothetical protein GcC1_161001 [Golovinomyces cichoracearum]